MKKILSSLFVLSLLPLIYIVLFEQGTGSISFYNLTLLTLILGVALYPLDLSFNSKKDFMIIPVLVYLIFSIINFFLVKLFDEKIAIINLLIGLFSFGQYYLQKNKRLSNNENF